MTAQTRGGNQSCIVKPTSVNLADVMAVLNPVDKFYRSVIEDVLLECREMFLDDGVDEIVLTELKQMWEQKVRQSKVFEFTHLNGSSSSFGMGSYGIISSSRNSTCPEILVPSIHLTAPRGDGLNNSCAPTATIALPYGLYQQQISALNNAGISLQPSGNGQFLAFLRPDQQRLQSLTTPQNLLDSGKRHPITVSTSSTFPIRPEAANLNVPVLNLVSTSPAKGMPGLKKQKILPTPTGFVGKVPNGNIAVKGAENNGYSNPVNMKINGGGSSVITAHKNLNNGASLAVNVNPRSAEQASPNVTTLTNISIPNSNNTARSNIKTIPIAVTANYSIMNNTNSLKTVTNTSATNSNSLVRNNCVVGTISPPVNTNTTTNTFSAIQNTYPPLSSSSVDINTSTVPQLSNKETYNNNNPSLGTLPNRYGNPPLTNSYPSNVGFYNQNSNTVVNMRAQTEGRVDVPSPAASLEDFMDNISNSNCESYSYSDPRPNTLIADGILSSDFNSSVNDLIRDNSTSNTYNTHFFPGSTAGSSLSTNYKPVPSGGEAVPGQMCRFSEEDMQTIQEILQLDGAGDEYPLEGKQNLTPQHQTFYSFSPRSSSVESNVSYEVNNPKTPKMESEELSQNGKVSRETKNFNDHSFSLEQSALHRLKIGRVLKTDSHPRDYVARKRTSSTRENVILPISTVSPGSNHNLTMNDQEYYLKTEIPKIGSSPKNKRSPLSARNVSNQASMLTLNCFGKLPNFTKETRSGITVGAISPASNSSDHQVVPVPKDISTINAGSPKHPIISKTAVETQRGFDSFHGRFPRQFDGEDADSSSSSDDNANANEAPSEDDEDDDECEETNEVEEEDIGVESEPLNSADDDSDIDICAMFESENIVVCQFEKVSRNKNKWKFHLKDGIMNLFGRDLVFSKFIGDAEW